MPTKKDYTLQKSKLPNTGIRPETFLEFSDPDFQSPDPDEVRRILMHAGLTGSQAGELLGVNSRTIRKWTGGEQKMPYSAWKLLLKTLSED